LFSKVIEEKKRISLSILKEISLSSSKDYKKEISFSSLKVMEEKKRISSLILKEISFLSSKDDEKAP
jgi:hypothetical protein